MALLAAAVAASYCSTAFDTTASRFSEATDAIDVYMLAAAAVDGVPNKASLIAC